MLTKTSSNLQTSIGQFELTNNPSYPNSRYDQRCVGQECGKMPVCIGEMQCYQPVGFLTFMASDTNITDITN